MRFIKDYNEIKKACKLANIDIELFKGFVYCLIDDNKAYSKSAEGIVNIINEEISNESI